MTTQMFVRRFGWHNWQESATLIKTTKNGWRIRWETGLHRGKTVNLTRRNWEVKPVETERREGTPESGNTVAKIVLAPAGANPVN